MWVNKSQFLFLCPLWIPLASSLIYCQPPCLPEVLVCLFHGLFQHVLAGLALELQLCCSSAFVASPCGASFLTRCHQCILHHQQCFLLLQAKRTHSVFPSISEGFSTAGNECMGKLDCYSVLMLYVSLFKLPRRSCSLQGTLGLCEMTNTGSFYWSTSHPLCCLLFRSRFGLRVSNWSFERPGLGVAAGELICSTVTPVPPEPVSKSLGKGSECFRVWPVCTWDFRW